MWRRCVRRGGAETRASGARVCETGSTPRVLGFSSPRAASSREAREEGLVFSSEATTRSAAERLAAAPGRLTADEQLAVEARRHRRTELVALRGELDLVTVSKVAEVLDGLEPQADGVRHLVLDLRGLTFMDLPGLHELMRQNEYARSNHHNLALVRGNPAV